MNSILYSLESLAMNLKSDRDDISLTLVNFSVDVMQEYNRSWNSGTSSTISFIGGVGLHSILY